MRVALVDDHPLVRSGLKAMMAAESDIQVVGEGADARDAYLLADARPDVMVLDVNLPGTTGIDAISEVKRRAPDSRLLMLTMYTDAARASQAFAAGANGYVFKGEPPEVLLEAVRTVARGERYVPPGLGEVAHNGHNGESHDGPLHALSRRERQIFGLLVRGLSNRKAAGELNISIKTVETHRTQIHRKLGVHSVAELMRFAALNGLIER